MRWSLLHHLPAVKMIADVVPLHKLDRVVRLVVHWVLRHLVDHLLGVVVVVWPIVNVLAVEKHWL